MMRQFAGSILFAALVCTAVEAQTIRKVPQDFPTIQAAIVAAQNGDTVRVAPGIYVENINFLGKAITVVSIAGADFTTIDGGQAASVVTFNTGEGLSSALDGFTIRNGNGSALTPGGGVRIVNASPTIRHNHVVNNFSCDAAGILANFSSALIQGNVISNNNTNPLVCSGSLGGGGILISGAASAQVLDNTISNNTNGVAGGGISLSGAGTPLIRGNIITGNSTINGGGISMKNTSDARIIQNVIAGNTATQIGGGSGGGIYALVGSGAHGPWITNNTIVDNDGGQIGSAIAIDGFDNLVPIKNNILIGKTGQPAVYCGNFNGLHLQPIFGSNDVFSDQAPAYTAFCADPTGTNGNISVDPLFADRAGQNFRLLTGSPGIDSGDNTVPDLIATDLDSFPRIFPIAGTIDMGPYEFVTTTTATISSANLSFADQNAGSFSTPIDVTMTNTGTANLLVSSVTVSGDYSQTNTCATAGGITPGQSCTVSVRFAPTVGGPRSGQLTISSNAGSYFVSLSGTGLAPLTLSSTNLSFGDQRVGTTSLAIPVSLSNNGFVDLNISGIATTGDFSSSNDCILPLAAGSSCTISIGFAPTVRGTRFGTINFSTQGTLYIVTLSGTGLAPTSDFSTSSLQFNNQVVGTTSPSQIVTVSNHGDMALTIGNISFNGDYGGTNNCGGSLAVNGTCTINVAFSPTATGTRNGSLIVSDDAVGSPHTIGLNGSGTSAILIATPPSLTFGNQAINTASASKQITLRNNGSATMTITSIVASSEFSKAGNCTTIFIGSTCSISVSFTPTTVGPKTGTVTIVDSAVGSPHTVSLSGTGVDLAFSPTPLSFGDVHIGTTATRTVTVANSSPNPVNIASLSVTAGYSHTSTCGPILNSGSTCSIDVSFSPVTAALSVPGTLTMTDDAIGSPHTLPLNGRGVAGVLSLSSNTLTYGADLVGTTSLPQTITVSNFGTGPLTFAGIATAGDFAQTTTCGTTLAINANCSISVTFSSMAPGNRTGSLTITSDGTVSASSVSLTGTGLAALAVPLLSTISPDNIATGASGMTLSVTGTGFSSLSVVRWGGFDRPTTFVSNTSLTAAIPASDFATMGTTPVSVFNPTPGGGTSNSAGFIVYRATTLTTKDLIYDRLGGRIYASVPATAPTRANTLTPLDPITGAFGTSAPIGTDPGKLAISNDSSFIYVALDGDAKVRRFDTASQSAGNAFTLGNDPFFGPYSAADIAISPGRPDTIAVSRVATSQYGGVAIYDSGVKRTVETPGLVAGSNVIEFSTSPSTLYGYNYASSEFGFRTMSVDTSGVAVTNVQTGLISGFGTDIQYEGGRIYSTRGQVVDPGSSTLIGTFPLPTGGDLRSVVADSTLQRAFFIFATPNSTRILAFDLNTFVQTGSVSLPGQSNTFSLSSLIRWGETGLAFRSGTQVFTFQIPDSWMGPYVPAFTLSPNVGQQSQGNLTVAITGQSGSFGQGQSTANFGAGITVNSLAVADSAHATANITIAAGAAAGLRNVSILTSGSGPAANGTFTVVVLPGLLAGWGTGSAQTGIPTGPFKAIAAGDSHSLAIRTDGTLVGWGSNAQGQINVPTGTFIAIAAGDSHTLAIRTDGTLAGWGANDFGQINVPPGTFTAIAAGAVHSLAIRTDGTLVGWGGNNFGQINVPSGTFTAIAAGTTHSLAIRTDGTLVGWGNNSSGQTNVPSGTFTSVAAGDLHSLALRTDGTLVGWGANASGQISVPSGTFIAIAAGEKSSFAIRSDGTVVSWGDTSFGVAPAGTFRSIAASRNRGVAIGKSPPLSHDFNGDNKSDVLWRDTSGNVYVWQMNGFTVSSDTLIAIMSPDFKIVGSGDFNADGKMDILWREGSTGNVVVWLMDGPSVSSSTVTGTMPASWTIAGVADFNGDGKADILWRNISGDVAVWLMNGASIASSTTIANISPGWTVSGTGDFNADGNADILWRENSGDVAIWLMNGTSVIRNTVVANIWMGWSIVGTGDFNADGMADVLWRENSGAVGIWLMNGTSVTSTRVVANIWLGWSIAGTGDFNADGKSDILWRDDSGNVAIWLMDGTNVADWAGRGNVADRIAQ